MRRFCTGVTKLEMPATWPSERRRSSRMKESGGRWFFAFSSTNMLPVLEVDAPNPPPTTEATCAT